MSEDSKKDRPSLEHRTWSEFADAGLLWWVNHILHLFGWALVYECEKDTGVITNVYPARCRFRGFAPADEDAGFKKVSTFLKEHADELVEDCHWSPGGKDE
jgi:hypothetical protein